MTLIKVSATSRTSAVAGAIAGVLREHHWAEVQAIGAGAVIRPSNWMLKRKNRLTQLRPPSFTIPDQQSYPM